MSYKFSGIETSSTEELHKFLLQSIQNSIEEDTPVLTKLSNSTAWIMTWLPKLNWVGFYFHLSGELVLGMFQGRPACTKIALGDGVCGTAALKRRTFVVDDVLAFPGHIACDSASKSEVVIPLIYKEKLLGVLDIDSPILNRFSTEDVKLLEKISTLLLPIVDEFLLEGES